MTYVRANKETWGQQIDLTAIFWTLLNNFRSFGAGDLEMVKPRSELVLSSLKVNTSLRSVYFFCKGTLFVRAVEILKLNIRRTVASSKAKRNELARLLNHFT